MTFEVAAEAYDRFMGRFSEPLADQFVDLPGVALGERALDVGCGPGALTRRLVDRLGVGSVCAIDPSEPFIEAVAQRFPGLDARLGRADAIPFDDASFDLAAAQLVVHFMSDPVAGLAEMARVTGPGGAVAACVWDHGSDRGPLAVFWAAARELDPTTPDESELPGTHEGQLEDYFRAAGLQDIQPTVLTVRVDFPSFDDWWTPFTLGVGPAGAHVATLNRAKRETLKMTCATVLPEGSFSIDASAWAATGRV
jgi:ubiquinone/menaquinone biosynthesis C-methylase UbiE